MFHRLMEILLGLDPGFLAREGSWSLRFSPPWPWREIVGSATWNVLLLASAAAGVIWVYRRDARSRASRIVLASLRGLALALLIALLNRPMLTLGQNRVESSVLAVMIDDSLSMMVPDAGSAGEPRGRLEAAVDLLSRDDGAMLRELAKTHEIRLYRFGADAAAVGGFAGGATGGDDAALAAIKALAPTDPGTRLLPSIQSVLDDLQGRRLAGVVVLSDGRPSPAEPVGPELEAIRRYNVRVFPVAMGTEKPPKNIELSSVVAQDDAFAGDIVNVKVGVRFRGYETGQRVVIKLRDKSTGAALLDADGHPAEATATARDAGGAAEVELQFKARAPGPLDVLVEATPLPGELDAGDNSRVARISILDANIAVLYVDGYPRWDYRYIKNEMMRDKSVKISCLLTSADPSFAQEGDRPIRRFPESMDELLDYDVVLFGDVDPRQFTDAQLQMIGDFVAGKGGGFGMVAGPKYSPRAYRNTAIESILPVTIADVPHGAPKSIVEGFRPVVTPEGLAGSIFRFVADPSANREFLLRRWQPLFWHCPGVAAKPGVGEVYAEHPTDIGPDGRKAPILVLGRFGAGRTMFSAIDDSWRWRFYTGEGVFDTYWVQQLRYLARGRKLGQRRVALAASRSGYELGERITVTLRILDPQLSRQLPDRIGVELLLSESAQALSRLELVRQTGQGDLFAVSWSADRVGRFSLRVPAPAPGVEAMDLPITVAAPALELADARMDRELLERLAAQTGGAVVEPADADRLAAMIPSAAKVIPVETTRAIWNAPLALALFALLLTAEWVMRKVYGLL